MSFTKAELEAMRVADAEIEADFCLTPDEIAAAQDRDERATFEGVCGTRTRAAPKSAKDYESDFQRFKAKRDNKRARTPEQIERGKAYCKAWAAAHREQRRLYRQAWYQKYRDDILIRQKAYHKVNREKRLAYGATYRKAHKDEIRAKQAAYRQKLKETKGGG